jgi:hypothetical protein
MPARPAARRPQAPPPSAALVERLARAHKKNLVGRPLTAALRDTGGKPAAPRPAVLILLVTGVVALTMAPFAGPTVIVAAAGGTALVAAAALWRQQSAARPTTSIASTAGELRRDAAAFDAFLAEISPRLPPEALTALARIKETLVRVIGALASADDAAVDIPAEESFFAHAMVARYLPDACRHYVEACAAGGDVPLDDGRTATESLCRQLDILRARLEKTLTKVAAGKADALVRHEAFVRTKE